MKVPVKISPCPLVETIAEVHFEPVVPSQAVFGMVFPPLRNSFPNVTTLPAASLPEAATAQNPALKYQPHYRLDSKDFFLAIGPRSFGVGTRGDYPGWAVLFPKFAETLNEALATGVAQRAERFGLRFINFFQGDIFANINLTVSTKVGPLVGGETYVKTVLDLGEVKALLQVGKDITLQIPFKPARFGSIIDIDCFVAQPPGGGFQDGEVQRFLGAAHDAEKQTFFSLLKDEFLNEFNPEY